MKVKSINVALNDYCNNKCQSCHIWENKSHHRLSPRDLESLLLHFPEIEDISLTGGEPFLEENLPEIIQTIIRNSRNLKMLFINTNGFIPDRVKEVLSTFSFSDTYLCVSLEGPEAIHNSLRGVSSYNNVIKTLQFNGTHKKVVSTTLQRQNCTVENMAFLVETVRNFGADLTFRFAEAGPYYMNESCPPNKPTRQQIEEVMKFMFQYRSDKFFMLYKTFLETGEIALMKDREVIKCKAGEAFITVQADYQIYPCIFSSRSIGSIKDGIKTFNDRGKHEPCPCFTECTIYPMLNYGGQSDDS